jgi:hypothetical protein
MQQLPLVHCCKLLPPRKEQEERFGEKTPAIVDLVFSLST